MDSLVDEAVVAFPGPGAAEVPAPVAARPDPPTEVSSLGCAGLLDQHGHGRGLLASEGAGRGHGQWMLGRARYLLLH